MGIKPGLWSQKHLGLNPALLIPSWVPLPKFFLCKVEERISTSLDTSVWVHPSSAVSPHQPLEPRALSQTLSSSSSSSAGAASSEEASFWAAAKVAATTSSSVPTGGSQPGIGGNPVEERQRGEGSGSPGEAPDCCRSCVGPPGHGWDGCLLQSGGRSVRNHFPPSCSGTS